MERPPTATDTRWLPHLFTQDVDTVPIHCVRPADTDRPTWAVYQHTHYLGTLHARPGEGWYIQATRELHTDFANAIRALRRPPTWPRVRAHAVEWARLTLGDPDLRVINIQTTGLHDPRALQIAVSSTHGTVFNELINPNHPVTPDATRLHHHTLHTTRHAPTFSDILDDLTNALHGRRCIAYNLPFVQRVLHAEIARHHGTRIPHRPLAQAAFWDDAIAPVAQWTGLWSAQHHSYRRQPLPSAHEAAAKCQALLRQLTALADN
ncbi:3'-5' exonuclease [Streptomyces sp. NPDC001717]|uniref:3'-5' exonuclease n=1 Tax=Streptomyces sp. NPDC001717 TaxID=3364604 RepID=UPI0036B5C858